MLKIQNLKKSYLTNFDMNIEFLNLEKGIHLIKGINGSGKSTLLKAIAGIHDFEGEIVLNGIAIKDNPVGYRRLVRYSEAEPTFPEFLSLDELIRFTADAVKAPAAQITELKNIFGVSAFSGNPISSYSSGMLKKSGLILAFFGHPQLVVLDEPFTTIDIATQKKLRQLIHDQLKQEVSFLVTSHLVDSERLYDYTSVLRLENGKLTPQYE